MIENFWPEQECPLCKKNARFRGVDSGQKKYFRCPICIDFVIPENREKTISKLNEKTREYLSKKSSILGNESALLIYFSAPVEGTSELKTEITPRDRWIP